MRTEVFFPMPKAEITWEGIGFYNGGLQRHGEFSLVLEWRGDDEIKVGEYLLTYEQAYDLYTDLIGATIATVVQSKRSYPFGVRTVVEVSFDDDDAPPPESTVTEITAWLRYALRVRDYTGSLDEWDYEEDGI